MPHSMPMSSFWISICPGNLEEDEFDGVRIAKKYADRRMRKILILTAYESPVSL